MFELHEKTKALLNLFEKAPYGTSFTYAQILNETECDVAGPDRHRILTVNRRLEKNSRKTLMNMRGVGYKIADPGEHVDSMRHRGDRAKTQLVRAKRTGEATPLEMLDDVGLATLTDQQVFNARVMQAFSVVSQRFSKHEKRLEVLEREIGIEPPADANGTTEEKP